MANRKIFYGCSAVILALIGVAAWWYYSNTVITTHEQSLPEFTLTDDNNHPFTRDNFRNHWTFLFFGYTNCMTGCSTILSKLNTVYLQLETQHIKPLPQVVFISLDTAHDNANALKDYLKNFNSHFVGATSNLDEINKLTKPFNISYAFAKMDDGSLYISHSNTLLIINPQGKWVASLQPPYSSEMLLKNYLKLINP